MSFDRARDALVDVLKLPATSTAGLVSAIIYLQEVMEAGYDGVLQRDESEAAFLASLAVKGHKCPFVLATQLLPLRLLKTQACPISLAPLGTFRS
jgi:hypothetical protein